MTTWLARCIKECSDRTDADSSADRGCACGSVCSVTGFFFFFFFGMQSHYRHVESAHVRKLSGMKMKNFTPVFRPLLLHDYGKYILVILLKPRCQFCSKPLVINYTEVWECVLHFKGTARRPRNCWDHGQSWQIVTDNRWYTVADIKRYKDQKTQEAPHTCLMFRPKSFNFKDFSEPESLSKLSIALTHYQKCFFPT